MEEIKENKSVVTSYRLREDTKEQLKQQLKDLDITQEEYFNRVVNLMELENVKQNSLLSKDTTLIQDALNTILKAFINVAEDSNRFLTNKDTELLELKNKYKDMLFTKDNAITNKNEELQRVSDENSMLQMESDKAKNELIKLEIENNKKLEQINDSLKDKTALVEEYKNKNDMLLSDLAEYKKYKIEIEQYKKLLADAQMDNIASKDTIKDRDFTISGLNKDIEKITADHEKELEKVSHEHQKELENTIREKDANISGLNKDIEKIIADHKKELEQLKEKTIFQIDKKELQLQQLHQKNIEELHSKHLADVESHQNKYEKLLEQLQEKNTKATIAQKDKPEKSKEKTIKKDEV